MRLGRVFWRLSDSSLLGAGALQLVMASLIGLVMPLMAVSSTRLYPAIARTRCAPAPPPAPALARLPWGRRRRRLARRRVARGAVQRCSGAVRPRPCPRVGTSSVPGACMEGQADQRPPPPTATPVQRLQFCLQPVRWHAGRPHPARHYRPSTKPERQRPQHHLWTCLVDAGRRCGNNVRLRGHSLALAALQLHAYQLGAAPGRGCARCGGR